VSLVLCTESSLGGEARRRFVGSSDKVRSELSTIAVMFWKLLLSLSSSTAVECNSDILGACLRNIGVYQCLVPELRRDWQKYPLHYGNLILKVLDCIVTVLFGVYLVLWLFQLVLWYVCVYVWVCVCVGVYVWVLWYVGVCMCVCVTVGVRMCGCVCMFFLVFIDMFHYKVILHVSKFLILLLVYVW